MRPFWQRSNLQERERGEIHPEEIFMDALNAPGFRAERAEGRIERPIPRASLLTFALILGLGLIAGAARLADLQLRRGAGFLDLAEANRTYPILIAPPRGIFYDRTLEPLVENVPTFAVSLKPEAVGADEEFRRVLEHAAAILGESVAAIAEANGLPPAHAFAGGRADWPREIFLAAGDLRDPVLEFQARADEFPGVVITESARRSYRLGPEAVHLLGYIGRPSREDLARFPGVRPTELLGKSGLELVYDETLRGQAGEKLVEVNALGEPLGERFIARASPGQDLRLEIDAELQRFAARTLARHIRALGKRAGALVAIDPRNGAVRALASYPDYDPDLLGGRGTKSDIERLLRDPADPLFNRAISGGYPSASTIKPLLAVAALEEGVITPEREIYDPGYISVPNPFDSSNPTIFKDWKALGSVDLRRAIAMSANVYFYTVGGGHGDIRGLGISRIASWLERFGWGSALGIDLPGEYAGLVPGPEKKKTIRPNDPTWRLGDTYITSIGQGDLQVTPLQLAAATAAIANGGTLWRPRVVAAAVDGEGRSVREFLPEAIRLETAHEEALAIVREGMRRTVTEGSATALGDLPLDVAGKTGTAQTGAYGKNHGWFVGFAPYENPEIVITVLVEEGTGGSTDAVPIAKEVFYYYLTAVRDRG